MGNRRAGRRVTETRTPFRGRDSKLAHSKTMDSNISEQMRQVLLDTVKFAIIRNHQCCKSDGLGNEVDLQDILEVDDLPDFAELAELEKDITVNGQPRNYNYVAVVTDHGNITLYDLNGVWSIV